MPQQWKISRVVMIFKKGDPAACSNYRPISLLSIGYKILASILLKRLKDAGAEDLIWHTQYGFRSKVGTADALFAVRRILDMVWSGKDNQLIFAALDWSKAFIIFPRLDFKMLYVALDCRRSLSV